MFLRSELCPEQGLAINNYKMHGQLNTVYPGFACSGILLLVLTVCVTFPVPRNTVKTQQHRQIQGEQQPHEHHQIPAASQISTSLSQQILI